MCRTEETSGPHRAAAAIHQRLPCARSKILRHHARWKLCHMLAFLSTTKTLFLTNMKNIQFALYLLISRRRILGTHICYENFKSLSDVFRGAV